MAAGPIRVGCAGWSLPPQVQNRFIGTGGHLERYASVFNAAEINSTFHRSHRLSTYTRWAAAVPDGFAFSTKLPRTITHERRLKDCCSALDAFLEEAAGLGDRLQLLLVQLPPSLPFDAAVTGAFLEQLRRRDARPVAVEPRHASWFLPAVDRWLADRQVARVLATPCSTRVVKHREDGTSWSTCGCTGRRAGTTRPMGTICCNRWPAGWPPQRTKAGMCGASSTTPLGRRQWAMRCA